MWPARWSVAWLAGIGAALVMPAGWIAAGVPLIVALVLGLMAGLLARPLLAAGLLGLAWGLASLGPAIDQHLDESAAGQDLRLTGDVVDLPERTAFGQRFVLRVDSIEQEALQAGALVRLNSYGDLTPGPGERWQLTVRLRPPSGRFNPGGFDYERWLFRHRVAATGYLREDEGNRLLAPASGFCLHCVRADLRDRVLEALNGHSAAGLVLGLAIGDRSEMTSGQWDTLLATGTNHLLAISGLHVGIVAGLAAFLMRFGWGRVPVLALRFPAGQASAWAALLAGFGYALLAGLSIPTQRAVLMLAIGLSGILLARRWRPVDLLALAAVVVTTADPLAMLDAGFWLSFAAVAVILVLLVGRDRQPGKIDGLVRLQLALFVGLLPLTALLFERAAWAAPIANLLAVPLVSVLVTPLTLLGTVATLFWPGAASWLLGLAAWLMQWLMFFLDWLAGGSLSGHLVGVTAGAVALAIIGMAWLLAPRGWPARWLGGVLLLPLLWPVQTPLPDGHFRLVALDVGQGLSVLVQTRHHALLYDAGPAWRGESDAGERLVVPALHALGLSGIDTLLISHRHNDHAGGAQSVIDAMHPDKVISGQPESHDFAAAPCRHGQRWVWDGVSLQTFQAERVQRANDRSCVLHVSGATGSALLTADIEWLAERLLVQDGLPAADLMLVPHHGSKTSSDPALLEAVAPRTGWMSNGYLNRFGHPDPTIMQRYLAQDVLLYDTAWCGALRLDPDGRTVCSRRDGYPWAWRYRPDPPDWAASRFVE
ncbi:MAG: DNA internalization-related competence protein ComEC/Rec2 [Halothiobacillaceae bacterium]